jgi:transcriptional regulator with XRE-family HTH domain
MAKRHPVLTAFGLNVRKQREARGLTQEALAEKADLDQTYISGVERGIRNPSVLSIAKIAKAFGVSLSQLTNGIRG